MQTWISQSLPKEELGRLEFLIGEFTSWQTMFPAAGQAPVQFRSVIRAHREGCDRFLRIEQFSDVPGVGLISSTALYSFNTKERLYECYGFSSAHEEPLRFRGNWEGDKLVLVSCPVAGYAGLQRFRHTLTPRNEECWEFLEERWELSGYVRHVVGMYLLCPI
ncbi:MAG: hypothetical protein QOJ65_1705 [Fimbriimonadaceae bacterium]|nr:hypothetical protein [Fimbriimonadaceae bacterium]